MAFGIRDEAHSGVAILWRERERWRDSVREESARDEKGEAMFKNNGEQLKTICTGETKQRESGREGKKEGGRLAFTTGASPKHITRAMHKYFTRMK